MDNLRQPGRGLTGKCRPLPVPLPYSWLPRHTQSESAGTSGREPGRPGAQIVGNLIVRQVQSYDYTKGPGQYLARDPVPCELAKCHVMYVNRLCDRRAPASLLIVANSP